MKEEIHQEFVYNNGITTWYVIDKDGNKKEFLSSDIDDEYNEYFDRAAKIICDEIDEEVKKYIDNMQSGIEDLSSVITFKDMDKNEQELYKKMLDKDEVVKENVF